METDIKFFVNGVSGINRLLKQFPSLTPYLHTVETSQGCEQRLTNLPNLTFIFDRLPIFSRIPNRVIGGYLEERTLWMRLWNSVISGIVFHNWN